jgi:hypothetical protein
MNIKRTKPNMALVFVFQFKREFVVKKLDTTMEIEELSPLKSPSIHLQQCPIFFTKPPQ